MSDTTTQPEAETSYPSLSETSDNDVRETSEEIAQSPDSRDSGSPDTPDTTQPAEPDHSPEDDLSARNARLARELREQKRIARQLEQYNAHLAGQRQLPQDEAYQADVNARAIQIAQQQQINAKSNDIFQTGVTQYGEQEFSESVRLMNEAFGQQNIPYLIETLVDLPEAAKLIQHLGDNPDIADQLAALPPHRMGAALAREAAKLTAPKAVSKAPRPIQPIASQSSSEPEGDIEKMSMEQLAKMWDKRDFMRRFQ